MFLIEKQFEYKGHWCVVTFTEIGYRCGYVSIPEDHKFYGRQFWDINDNEELPFKLSDAGTIMPMKDGHYWIGFTCDNRGDKPDINRVKEVFGEKPMVLTLLNMSNVPVIPKTGEIRSTEYVIDKIKKLVDSL